MSKSMLTLLRYIRPIYVTIPLVVLLLLALGWLLVEIQRRTIVETNILTFQQTQLDMVHSVGRTISAYVEHEIEDLGNTNQIELEEELAEQFIEPIRLLSNGHAHLYAKSHIVSPHDHDFPKEYLNRPISEVFKLQERFGASNYQKMLAAIEQQQHGVGDYVWNKEIGTEIASWAPISYKDYSWVIVIATPRSEILNLTNVTGQIRTLITLMSIATLIALIMLLVWVRNFWQNIKTQQALRANEEALQQAQKLESLGLLASGIAHDFNNLLGAIIGQSSLILRKLHHEHAARGNAEKLNKAAEQAVLLTNQLLAYTGKTQLQRQLVNLNQMILDNLRVFEITIRKNVHVEHDLQPDLPMLEADIGQIQQVLMNLILNGADAIGEKNGTLRVETDVAKIDEDDILYSVATGKPLQAGTYLTVDVRDSGCGMSPQTLRSIFDPFFTTKPHGRGLGLAAVIGAIRSHNAGLIVESEEGVGTLFRIFFPITDLPNIPTHESTTASVDSSSTLISAQRIHYSLN